MLNMFREATLVYKTLIGFRVFDVLQYCEVNLRK